MTKSKIGIVGGSGFIGFNLARYLQKNFEVRIIDIKPPTINPKSSIEYLRCDIRKFEEIKKAITGLDLIIHTAIIQIPRINEEKHLGYQVNVIGTQNVCKAVDESESVKGLVLAGTWQIIGEREINGVVDESFGYRPDKVENRARIYVLSKILQETIVRYYDEMSKKIFGIIRMGTVLGEGMPDKTAANIFIEQGLRGYPITPYKHSMYRPMLYIDIRDVCRAFEIFVNKILNCEITKNNSLNNIITITYPDPITILDLSYIVRDILVILSNGRIKPEVKIIDKGLDYMFSPVDKNKFRICLKKAEKFLKLDINHFYHPAETIRRIISKKLGTKDPSCNK